MDTLNFREVNLLRDLSIFTDRKHFRNMNSVIFSCDDVGEWMKKEGFQGFADIFSDELVDGEALFCMNEETLKSLVPQRVSVLNYLPRSKSSKRASSRRFRCPE